MKQHWNTEREKILKRLCARIARRVAAGAKLKSIVSVCARELRGRCYKSNPGRRVMLSKTTLLRIWYQFRKEGETAFRLDYGPNILSRVPVAWASRYLRACIKCPSQIEAYRRILRRCLNRGSSQKTPSLHACRRVLDRTDRQTLFRLHRLRRAQHKTERELVTFLHSRAAEFSSRAHKPSEANQ